MIGVVFKIFSRQISFTFKMNKLILSLVLGLFITACQNTPKSGSDSPLINPSTATTPGVASPEMVQEASAKLISGVEMAEALRKQVDELPAKLKKEKSAEIDGMYATLEGLIEKQTGMLNEITASKKLGTESSDQERASAIDPSPALISDYTESAVRYAQEVQTMQEAVQKMATPVKKD